MACLTGSLYPPSAVACHDIANQHPVSAHAAHAFATSRWGEIRPSRRGHFELTLPVQIREVYMNKFDDETRVVVLLLAGSHRKGQRVADAIEASRKSLPGS